MNMEKITRPSLTKRAVMGILDVLPIPNFHEVIKSVIRDNPECKTEIIKLIELTLNRLDVPRTVIAVAVGLLLILL